MIESAETVWRLSDDGRNLLLIANGLAVAAISRWADKDGETTWWGVTVHGKDDSIYTTLRDASVRACDLGCIAYLLPPSDLLAEHGEASLPNSIATSPTTREASEPVTPFHDNVVEAVRADLLSRSQIGIKKYGVTLDRTDVDLRGWLQHAYEETLDQANYLKRAILEIDATAADKGAPDA